MKLRTLSYALLCSVLFILMSVAAASSFAQVNANDCARVAVIPAEQNYQGLSYGEWSTRWWQWVFSLPYDNGQHPLFDTTGDYAALGQSGNVWFLGGLFWPNGGSPPAGPVVRTITIPRGTALFFPIANSENNNVEAPGLTLEELWAYDSWAGFKNDNLYATIDGRAVRDLTDYLTVAPVFGLILPDDNVLYSAWNIGAPGATSIYPEAAAGFFLMVKPLPVGKHRITFGVKNLDWSMDIVYKITVQ